ncbi:hypothetical protein E2562_007043 [Oryza meyeriana var. granulata]|uniref:Transposase Tnp1/En/Spm-like domain-containing protein n=1 Tax=Oryza meyeriana var. granulata TaxID=110450 RepID=A0A6G1EA17_9ORYZ|nr:hypothetical protein E2562_007043 [Oryza meyeriana var. granulata]
MEDEMWEQRMAHGIRNVEITSNIGSNSQNQVVGKEVILYAMLRSDLPVAKGTIVSTDPSTELAGGRS